jgi:Fe-S oxidoreductase
VKIAPPEKPTSDWSYDDPDYWDPAGLERELRRVAEVCHQCRRCLPLCPSFPTLFDLVDGSESEVAGVLSAGFERVNELCFHCKLCYNHCPYTPPHEWDVDFPALMRRQQLQRTRREGVPLARRLTSRTDLLGRAARLAPALMNFANRSPVGRVLMEKAIGIHRDWVQPTFHRETFTRWFARRGSRSSARGEGEPARVVLFATCSVEFNDPAVGRAAVEVLERSGIAVEARYARCCGMPFTDVGDLAALRRHAEANVADLLPSVEAGATVVVPGPSCSLLLKTEYPKLLGSEGARRVAAATRDLMEHLVQLAREQRLDRGFVEPLGKVAYHAPCHLRHQNVGFPARALLRAAGAEVELVDACSGVDGTWGMQARFHDESMKVARRMLDRIREAGADHVATDCPLAALRIREGLGLEPVHPIQLLRRAYGDGSR